MPKQHMRVKNDDFCFIPYATTAGKIAAVTTELTLNLSYKAKTHILK